VTDQSRTARLPCRFRHPRRLPWLLCVIGALLTTGTAGAQIPDEVPFLVGEHTTELILAKASGALFASGSRADQSRATQLAIGPGPDPALAYLYLSSNVHGVRRLEYTPQTGQLSNLVDLFPSWRGNGVAVRRNSAGRAELYAHASYPSDNAPERTMERVFRVVDEDGDGVFGSSGDRIAAIVQGIPSGRHSLNQIQIHGRTLYTGYGVRTFNGAVQGDPLGESAFGGTILMIDDLDAVPTVDDAAGFPAYRAHPTEAEFQAVVTGAAAGSEAPFTSTAPDKLRIHSAGARNPFGITIDHDGDLWLSVNFHRVNNSAYDRRRTGDDADQDGFDGPSDDDVHDQLFRARPRGDYGSRNGNWQGRGDVQAAGFFAGLLDPTLIIPSVTFDNYDHGGHDRDHSHPAFNRLHDPAQPVELGPHSAVTGLAFAPLLFPVRYYDHVFVTRWNGQFGLLDGLDYRDLVLVDATLGDVERVAAGFNAPIDIVHDGYGSFLVVSYFGSIWRLTPRMPRCHLCGSPRRQ